MNKFLGFSLYSYSVNIFLAGQSPLFMYQSFLVFYNLARLCQWFLKGQIFFCIECFEKKHGSLMPTWLCQVMNIKWNARHAISTCQYLEVAKLVVSCIEDFLGSFEESNTQWLFLLRRFLFPRYFLFPLGRENMLLERENMCLCIKQN